jgi:hypothetical protein
MKRIHLFPFLLAACGGNVVVDKPGAQGTGGHTHATTSSNGAGGGVVMTGGVTTSGNASTGTGQVSCQTGACSVGADGSCACTGTCNNGDTVSADCPPGSSCTCSVAGPNHAMVATCTPSGQGNPCDLMTGCCAQFF